MGRFQFEMPAGIKVTARHHDMCQVSASAAVVGNQQSQSMKTGDG